MGTPADYLPGELSNESISELSQQLGLSVPSGIKPLKVTATYHSIYLLRYEGEKKASIPARADPDGSVTLVLRVSGHHLPRVKTMNEVGAMRWVRQNTNIPVPKVLKFSAEANNPIGHEFTLLERVPGTSLDNIYEGLNEEDKKNIVHQLVNILVELHSKPWLPGFVGGLIWENGAVVRGPPLEETFWQVPDIEIYWPGESLESLNPLSGGPFDGYTAYVTAALQCYIHAMERHPSLERFRAMVPHIERFISAINSDQYKPKLNSVKYVLAHKDLHFANIMCDPADPNLPITAVLDWEFSGVVPATRWNPVRAFLWNGKTDARSKEEQSKMEKLFETVCLEKGASNLLEDVKPNGLQESMQTAVSRIRAIVEVCPRGQAQDKVDTWRETAEASMAVFA
jgi:aminoglycoside phosphotransferase (APT) family kinase protein